VGLWAAWAFSGELPQRWQWAGTAAVLLGLVINQAGPLRALVKGIAERRR
jgi:drug/metabolite transporter (DMT)-like permease